MNTATFFTFCREAASALLFPSQYSIVNSLLLIFFGLGIFLVATYLFTLCRFYATRGPKSRFAGSEPPTVPYWIPFVGSALSMVTDPHKFFMETLVKRPDKGPMTMRLGPIRMYLIMGADNIQSVFRYSRQLSFEFMQLRIAEKVKGLPAHDAQQLGADDSGTGSAPLSNITENGRIWHKLHAIYLKNLTEKKAVDFLTDKFVSEFSKQLQSVPWQYETMGLLGFLQKYQFNASTTTLVGPRILDFSPQFVNNFWDYDAAFMTLMQGMPRFMRRGGWAARDRCLEATKEWLAAATENSGRSNITPDDDPDWDENFGHRLVRERNAALLNYGISFDGRAAMHMGLIWAINANAIPMTAYMLIEMVRNPSLLQRIRSEVQTAMVPGKESSSALAVDIEKLSSLPLLNSVYNECLRLRSSIPISRRLRVDVEIDGYTLKANNFILAPSWVSHINEDVWAHSGHPASEFWAERFLEKKSRKVKLGDYCPYGGGNVICPGRFFAKHEILAAVALVVTFYDMEFVRYSKLDGAPSERGPGIDKAECRGIVSLDRDVVVDFRKRSILL
ncbi:hypothetical protein AJ80_09142 [Polytolypa hystricis UAMH7299]|uniref:Cytochrome P450 oxidoreductase n=1 Tax=Polytolypa hystricis (strain UAMH7299) TaxID=1447883 RepID=A0A2B7WVX7_POLH7|nr:hypothetical protein AJ80_09142 [Polytolypa hystricis UAMH7299]